jgi:ArsR family transcriptional regulator
MHDEFPHHEESVSSQPQSLAPAMIKDLVHLFKLLSDETRLQILYYLLNNSELHVRALCELLGQSQPAVSHHLALLRETDLIASRRDGKHNFYHLQPHTFQELLNKVFAAIPLKERRYRFEDYVLSYSPPTAENPS